MFLLRRLSGKHVLGAPCQGTLSTGSHTEDDASKQVIDQASDYVTEGNYEKALWLLEKLGQLDPAVKGVAELVAVAEVSYAAVWRSCSCLSRESRNHDWYKILKVDEKSELSVIKKRYRHLALLLHPDKNKHVKAEAAFKLVSEAYACLSDKKKRANFNVRRSLTKCRHCSSKDCISSDSDRWSDCHVFKEKKKGFERADSSPDLSQADWILDQERLRIFRARARARVFGNLARVWKERGFTRTEEVTVGKERGCTRTRTEEVTVGKERFCECNLKQSMMTSDQHQCKEIINENKKNREENLNTRQEPSPMTHDDEMGKGSMGDMNNAMISRPYKNLRVLIHDLQAELASSLESTGEQKCQRKDVLEQSTTWEGVLETDSMNSGSHAQEGAEAVSTMLGPRVEGDAAQHSSGALRTCLQNHAINAAGNSHSAPPALSHSYHDSVLNDSLSTLKNDSCSASDFASKSCSNKIVLNDTVSTSKNDSCSASGFASKSCSNKEYSSCEKRRESFMKVESDSVIECEAQQRVEGKDFFKTKRNKEHNGSASKKFNLCKQIGKGDSLDLEETILQTQKEKSEQLLKTLQRLREETKTVAASLDHFCSGCSY